MFSRLNLLIEKLLLANQFETIDTILLYLDVEHPKNTFDDLIDIVKLCNNKAGQLNFLGSFRKKLVQRIYEERGEESGILISKIMNY